MMDVSNDNKLLDDDLTKSPIKDKLDESDEMCESKKENSQPIENIADHTPEHQPTHLAAEMSPENSPVKKFPSEDAKEPTDVNQLFHLTHNDELKALSAEETPKCIPKKSADDQNDTAADLEQTPVFINANETPKSDKKKASKKTSSPKISPRKLVKESKGNDSDDEEEEKSDDNDSPLPTLEAPLVVSGKRHRQSVQRLQVADNVKARKPTAEFYAGTGTPLGEIAEINDGLSAAKTSADKERLHALHRLIYNRPGKSTDFRKNLRKFSGFNFEKDSDEYKQRVAKAQGMSELIFLSKFCHVYVSTQTKEERAEALIEYLNKPFHQANKRLCGIHKPKKRKSSTMKTKQGNDDEQESDEEEVEKMPTPKRRKLIKDEEESNESDHDEKDDEDAESTETPSPKLSKVGSRTSVPTKASPKKEKAKKSPSKSPSKKQTDDKKSFLDELVECTKQVVADSDMDTTTMKEIMRLVSEHFSVSHPKLLLNDDYKAVIKEAVKEIISKSDDVYA